MQLLVVLHRAGVSSAKHARDIIIESSFFLWDISPPSSVLNVDGFYLYSWYRKNIDGWLLSRKVLGRKCCMYNHMEFEYLYYIYKLKQKYVLIEIFERESIWIPTNWSKLSIQKNANRDGDMYFWDLLCYCYMDTLLSILVRQATIDRKSILCWLSKSYTVTLVRLFTHDWRLLLHPLKVLNW